MKHVAKLCFADGVVREVAVPEGDDLLGAALQDGVKLEHQCLSGSCGSCICRLLDGQAEQRADRVLGLLPFEVAEGYRLACSIVPKSDTVWQFDYPSTMLEEQRVSRVSAKVEGVKAVSASVIELTLRISEPFPFRAGQYVRMCLPDGTARSISMASAPEDLPKAVFLVRLVPGGALSTYLSQSCRPGDAIELEGPYGTFILPERIGPSIFVAGGTGLAPILSMLDHIQGAGMARAPLVLCFGTAKQADFFYGYEFELRREWMPTLSVRLACEDMDPASDASQMVHGNVVSLLQPQDVGAGTTAFICGPPAMVTAASERLLQFGIAPENIITERFNPS